MGVKTMDGHNITIRYREKKENTLVCKGRREKNFVDTNFKNITLRNEAPA